MCKYKRFHSDSWENRPVKREKGWNKFFLGQREVSLGRKSYLCRVYII